MFYGLGSFKLGSFNVNTLFNLQSLCQFLVCSFTFYWVVLISQSYFKSPIVYILFFFENQQPKRYVFDKYRHLIILKLILNRFKHNSTFIISKIKEENNKAIQMTNIWVNPFPVSISQNGRCYILKQPFKFLASVVRKQLYSSEVRHYNKIVIHMVSKCWNWHLPWSLSFSSY